MVQCPVCQSKSLDNQVKFCTTCGWNLTPNSDQLGQAPEPSMQKEKLKLSWAKQMWQRFQSKQQEFQKLQQQRLTLLNHVQSQLEQANLEKKILETQLSTISFKLEKKEQQNRQLQFQLQQTNRERQEFQLQLSLTQLQLQKEEQNNLELQYQLQQTVNNYNQLQSELEKNQEEIASYEQAITELQANSQISESRPQRKNYWQLSD